METMHNLISKILWIAKNNQVVVEHPNLHSEDKHQ